MKKIAIMTWHHYLNYGTALQVTALSHVISKFGFDTNVINYVPHGKVVTKNNYKSLSLYIMKIRNKITNKNIYSSVEREKNFSQFLSKNIKLTCKCSIDSELFKLNDEFDAFVCGSDQIWAPSCFNSKYFLEFVKNPNKMIAYAPSIGLFKINDLYIKKRMKECINKFKYISVREDKGKQLIKDLCGKEVPVVLDPTLLLSANDWDQMYIEKKYNKPYILCYFLGNNKKTWNHVKKISEKMKIPIKIIPVFKEDLKRGWEVEEGVGPEEFLNLIKNATFICTDSFHGTLFSIIYEKPFYVYERFSNNDCNSQNSRIYNILSITQLERRLIKNNSVLDDNFMMCDFVKAKNRLEDKKKYSLQYLQESLRNSTKYSLDTDQYSITNTCCGCAACTGVCKQNAIEIRLNNKGFLEAFIDKDKCIKCGLCSMVCPYNGKKSLEINEVNNKLYMMYSKDNQVLKQSSSGGIAYEISKLLCNKGYDVIGCVYDHKKRKAIHMRVKANDIEKLNEFQGSKYIQSNITSIIPKILNSINKTLIIGTPCQIAGINRLLKIKGIRNKFILIDLICHGVPSQKLWDKYINEGNDKFGYGLNPQVIFRDKRKGWRNMFISLSGNHAKYSCIDKKDLFYRFFLRGHCYSDSCYECAYRTVSEADIRLGDYWGPRYKNNKKGVSMVITMNKTGEKILKELSEKDIVEFEQMECKEYWTVQYPYNPIKPVFYNELIDDLNNKSFNLEKIADNYCKEYEFYEKLYHIYQPLKKIILKMRK